MPMKETDIKKIPAEALEIIAVLEAAGFEAWLVGGCVRDLLRGSLADDWDIATSALPEAVQGCFPQTVPTGLRHGTVTVLRQGRAFEVTTYRAEGPYTDHRRPDGVVFVTALEQDLARRDFTVNAMAWHPVRGLRDPFGGQRDLARRVLRAVGNPDTRFREDALRMLRAVRFAAQLDFDIDPATLQAITREAGSMALISGERVRVELDKWLLAAASHRWGLFRDTGLMAVVLPELDRCFQVPQNTPWHLADVGTHSLQAAAKAPRQRAVRWALLLHDIGKAQSRVTDAAGRDHFQGHGTLSESLAAAVLDRLRWDKATRERILHLIRHHDREVLPEPRAVRRAVARIGSGAFGDWLAVRRADLAAQAPVQAQPVLTALETVEALWQAAEAAGACLTVNRLAISGRDLMALGVPQGPEVGVLLNRLLEQVLEEPALNERARLLELAAELKLKPSL